MRRNLEPFRFKQFQVKHSESTLAVGTDAILLSSWVRLDNIKSVLDVGTGCGLIALSIAQRLGGLAHVTAIDIDELSVEEARFNFLASNWSDQLVGETISFEELAISELDLIISNPPFFRESLKNELEHKVKARHQTTFCMESFANFCSRSLSKEGKVALVYPSLDLDYLTTVFENRGFSTDRICLIKPKPAKGVNRVLIEFSRNKTELNEESLLIRNEDNSYSEAYQKLTKDYYLKF